MKPIKTPLQITSVRALNRTDGISFTAHTPELTNEEKLVFFELQGLNLDALLAPEESTEIPIEVKAELEEKSPSQRLMAIIAVYCKEVGRPEEARKVYVREQEKLIDKYKRLLDERK